MPLINNRLFNIMDISDHKNKKLIMPREINRHTESDFKTKKNPKGTT